MLQECGGSISYLAQCLTSIGRNDVVSLISQYHSLSKYTFTYSITGQSETIITNRQFNCDKTLPNLP